ncbi:alpha-L-rhamnosidase [Anopheles sinensis]|uniref:Alpha-L-rhamnosidase n=1 Tax=Anopheles sinensis TaxID=74873 RepID=A0A084VLG4_ANOSI|nr:alpha-L-rhamnosidase [Anopheles sinensis]
MSGPLPYLLLPHQEVLVRFDMFPNVSQVISQRWSPSSVWARWGWEHAREAGVCVYGQHCGQRLTPSFGATAKEQEEKVWYGISPSRRCRTGLTGTLLAPELGLLQRRHSPDTVIPATRCHMRRCSKPPRARAHSRALAAILCSAPIQSIVEALRFLPGYQSYARSSLPI